MREHERTGVRFDGELFLYGGREGEAAGSWFFVRVPLELAEEIREVAGPPRGFGSVRVTATVGGSTWRTSVFPEAKTGCFLLPVKKQVRIAENIEPGDRVRVVLEPQVDA